MTENKTMELKNKAEVEYMNYLINLEINGVQFIKLSKSSSEFNITVPENAEQFENYDPNKFLREIKNDLGRYLCRMAGCKNKAERDKVKSNLIVNGVVRPGESWTNDDCNRIQNRFDEIFDKLQNSDSVVGKKDEK